MDISRYLVTRTAPQGLFDVIPERAQRPRFWLPRADGGWTPMTWGEFGAQVQRAGSHLLALGLRAGERGAVFAPNRVEWLSAALGIQAVGGVMVPVYPASTAEQAAYVIEHSDARVVYVDTEGLLGRLIEVWGRLGAVAQVVYLGAKPALGPLLEKLAAKGVSVPGLEEVEARVVGWAEAQAVGEAREAQAPGEFAEVLEATDLEQPGLMLYTSGTTGNPKGVPLTHRNVGVNGHDWLRCNGPLLDEQMVDVLWLPMSHIFGFGEACLGNTLGFESYLSDPAKALVHVRELKPSVFMSVPSMWEKMAQGAMQAADEAEQGERLREATGGRLQFCLSGGAGLKQEIKEFYHKHGILIVEGYGLTEASPTLTLNRPDAFRFDTVGKPLPSIELKLAEDGEIWARGPSIFGGYHKDPEASSAVLTEDGWLKTGDLGRFTEDGFLQIIGRKKEILVTAGGKNVPPANIEARFQDDPLVAHAVVYGDGKRYLVVGLWPNEAALEAALDAQGVGPDSAAREAASKALLLASVERVNERLASYESLKRFALLREPLTVEGGLLTPTLKIKRNLVYARFREAFEALYGG
jgi:long-chain acyl-CoA synthetase